MKINKHKFQLLLEVNVANINQIVIYKQIIKYSETLIGHYSTLKL